MRIDFSDKPEPALFVIELDEEQEVGGVRMGRGAKSKYDNRVAVHRLSADPIPDNHVPAKLPCNLKGGPFVFTGVTARLGLLPDPRCRFRRLRVEMILGEGVAIDELRPVVCHLYPPTARTTVKKIRSIETTIGLGVHVNAVELTGPMIKEGTKVEVDATEIGIIAFGFCSSTASWDFKITEANPELAGDFVVYLVAATAAGVASWGEIRVSAEIEDVRKRLHLPFFSPKPEAAASTQRFALTHA